jgi:hypothetical protein
MPGPLEAQPAFREMNAAVDQRRQAKVFVPKFFASLSQVNDRAIRAAMLSAARAGREMSGFERACFVVVMTSLMVLVAASLAFVVL